MHHVDGKPAAAKLQMPLFENKSCGVPGNMNPEPSIRDAINNLLEQQKLGVLSTAGKQGAPYASLVAFSVSDDHRYIYFITPQSTRKYANLSANPQAALLINSSINQPEDFHQAMAVTATGAVKPVAAREREAVLQQYMARHPNLEAFARSPGCALLAIRVERYILVQRFQNVTEYRLDPENDHTS